MSEPVTPSDKRARLERIALLSAVVAAAGFASTGAQAACSPWNSSTAYTAGNTVTENGVTYKANWWTQSNDPANSNGASGTGQPWTITSSCSATPPPPPPAPNPPPPSPTPAPPASCLSSAWQRGINYPVGAVVLYTANGSYYKEVNAGTNGSDGTDPTISTWYWQPTTCSGGGSTPPPPPPPPAPTPSCSSSTWQGGINYPVGTVVLYPGNGSYYKEVNAGSNGSDGTDPTISTWYWQPTTCSSGGGGGTGGSFVVSEAQFNQMFPSRNGLYSYAGLINAMGAYPAFAHTGSDTTQKQEAAAFLANVAEESDSLRATREYNTANWPLYCDTSNGNTCAPGQQYEGRGPLQLSWNYNYLAAGNALGVNLWANPDLVATDSTITWKTAVWYWMTGTGNAGVTPHNAMVNGQGFGTTIRAINGSVECNGGNPAEVQTRINFYNSFTGLIGVTPGGNLGC